MKLVDFCLRKVFSNSNAANYKFDARVYLLFPQLNQIIAGILLFCCPILLSSYTDFLFSSCPREVVLLGKGVLKICSKFTGEHLCRSVISIKWQSNLFLRTPLEGCFCLFRFLSWHFCSCPFWIINVLLPLSKLCLKLIKFFSQKVSIFMTP